MMDAVSATTIIYNVASTVAVSGGVAFTLWKTMIKPNQEALARANAKLKEFADIRVRERLDAHAADIVALESETKEIRHQEIVLLGARITDAFERAVSIDANGRRQIHDRLDRIDRTVERLCERTEKADKTNEILAQEVREIGKEVAAALAQNSERRG